MSTRYVWGKYNTTTSNGTYDTYPTETLRDLTNSSYQIGADYTVINSKFVLTGSTSYIYAETTGGRIRTSDYPCVKISDTALSVYFSTSTNSYWVYAGNELWVVDYDDQYEMRGHYVLLNPKGGGDTQGSLIGYVSSSSSSAYPSDGVSGSYWYKYLGSDNIDPYSIFYSTSLPQPGSSITLSVSPRSPSYSGTIYYQYQYSINGGSSWTNIGSRTTATSCSITVPSSATQFRARVLASDNLGFTSSTYVTGSNLTVTKFCMVLIDYAYPSDASISFSGAGTYYSGASVTVSVINNSPDICTFIGWRLGSSTGNYVGYSSTYTFTITNDTILYAEFEAKLRDNYIGIGGVAKQIDKIYIGVNGVAKEVEAGFIGVNGVAKQFYG